MNIDYDVLVVGSGIVGLGHALAAHDDGLRVILIDRDARPVGASVRNFGHVCATGQSRELRELALGTRERWLSVAARTGLPIRQSAGAAVARAADEVAVMEELADKRDAVELRTAAQIRADLGGVVADDVVGGARLHDDLRVDPRTTAPRLADWLGNRDGVEFRWRTAYLGIEEADATGARVRTSGGAIAAGRVFVCVGHDLDYLAPAVADDAGMERCALQMMLTEDPGIRVPPAVLTATSLLRYDAFAETSAAAALRTRLELRRPELFAADTNIMFTQRPDGGLLIGDSHRNRLTVSPFLDESVSALILGEVEAVLGRRLRIRERWQGVYAARPAGPYLTARLAPNVHACSVTTGVGMTVGLELAARSLAGTLTS
ncbi:TIGR03364 family FAD-dependent oxidoreductase [Gordonia neofelifaecis]|uniref:FAD dependent oxidoreductase TIGR03364 n=1 Tax=Gordonia neofelifaecis NRRL B-59395 TaxID=644548 RepID=F1YG43_9ACTN|nr:TIGR03364 family FAD-dependent oxidoreductase [Gordonia neofelifaecis]EGD56166.1 FAD dependent oxidoreductase TIGR03364 [Gordonia neofelifaecis NRRL B-59395]